MHIIFLSKSLTPTPLYKGVNSFAFFAGTLVEENINKLSLICTLALDGVWDSSTLYLAVFLLCLHPPPPGTLVFK